MVGSLGWLGLDLLEFMGLSGFVETQDIFV